MGVFGAPQGVRGEVRVKSLTGEPSAIGVYGPLTNKGRTRAFAFESLRSLKDDMLVALAFPFYSALGILRTRTMASAHPNGLRPHSQIMGRGTEGSERSRRAWRASDVPSPW